MKKIAITTGDPAGIGPEVVKKCFSQYHLQDEVAYIIYGDNFLPPGFSFIRHNQTSSTLKVRERYIMIIDNPGQIDSSGQLYAVIVKAQGVTPGKPDSNSNRISYDILKRVVADIKKHRIDALVTAPLSKTAIREFEPDFIGHTEFLAREFNSERFVMNFISYEIDVALLTTHTALKQVTEQIREELIIPKIRLIYEFAHKRRGNPKVALLGLNPHCGEDAAFGDEENILRNAINKLREEGIVIDGPFPADSFFRYRLKNYHQIIACYHDQGLIPFKLIAGERGVNVTLGLPFLRTSVDHGTAYDIAGKFVASPYSMLSALKLADDIIKEGV